jgi:predicted transposase/invertase (TIGR01784 family)
METDSFFCQLLQRLPETLFELLGLPPEQAAAYRFDSVEVKKSLRIDGLFAPKKAGLPVYFVEVQFRRLPTFYPNLFAKVFWYLETHGPDLDWVAVALFPNRSAEPKEQRPYQALLASPHVRRVYLDELTISAESPLGLRIMQLVTASAEETPELVAELVAQAGRKTDSEMGSRVIELIEEILLRRFTQLDREEIRRMFELHDIRESKVWQEAHQTGIEKGIAKGRILARRELIRKQISKGKAIKQIAEEWDIPVAEVRRLAKNAGK